MTNNVIHTTIHDGALRAWIAEGAERVEITLRKGHAERDLEEAHILLRAAGGQATEGLRRHFEAHWTRGSAGQNGCGFCKLGGRILASEGRRKPSEAELARANITVVAVGVTKEGMDRSAYPCAEREKARLAKLPFLGREAKQSPLGPDELF